MKGTVIENMRRASLALTTAATLLAVPLPAQSIMFRTGGGTTDGDWQQTHRAQHQKDRQQDIDPSGGETATYYRWRTNNGCVVNLVVVDLSGKQWTLRTVANPSLATAAQTAQKYGAPIAVNGGFFDPRTGAGVGCLIDLGHAVGHVAQAKRAVRACTPKTAQAIRNRSELRLTVDANGTQSLSVAAHDAPIAAGATIEESLQAGPALLPQYDPVKEGFIRRNTKGRLIDSIGTASREARTAIGITADGKLLLLTVYNPTTGPDKGGMTLPQVAALLKSLGAVEALNLDGGTSTSMYLHLKDSSGSSRGVTVSGNWPPRRVQSVLLLLPKPEAKQDDHIVEQRCEICQGSSE